MDKLSFAGARRCLIDSMKLFLLRYGEVPSQNYGTQRARFIPLHG